MLRRAMMAGASVPVGNVQFDPAQKHSAITLSAGNLIATGNAGSGGHVKSLTAHATGKRYLEIELVAWSAVGSGTVGMIGLVTALTSLVTIIGGGAGGTAIWSQMSGNLLQTYFEGASTTAGTPAASNGATIMMAWDADAGSVWFGVNGTWISGDPAAGTSPTYTNSSLTGAHHFGVCPRNTGNQLRVKTSPTYPVPAGFSYW